MPGRLQDKVLLISGATGIAAATARLAKADKDVAAKPNDLNALFGRGLARFHLGHHSGALEDFNVLVRRAPLPADRNPVLVYLHAVLAEGSRPAQHDALKTIANFFATGKLELEIRPADAGKE